MDDCMVNALGPCRGTRPEDDLRRLARRRARRRFLARIPGLAWRGVKLVVRMLWEAFKLYLFVLLRLVSFCLRAI